MPPAPSSRSYSLQKAGGAQGLVVSKVVKLGDVDTSTDIAVSDSGGVVLAHEKLWVGRGGTLVPLEVTGTVRRFDEADVEVASKMLSGLGGGVGKRQWTDGGELRRAPSNSITGTRSSGSCD